ncbi:MAG: hypothetical protein EON92_02215 [Burkholderiales bacterium]|nr:MAG: hypothetical protein EON92_02215 [Burkholderiales bacterium]
MKSTALVLSIAAATLGFSSLSQAQDHDRRGPSRDQRFEQPQQRGDNDRGFNRGNGFDRRADNRGFDRRNDQRVARQDHRRFDRQDQRFHRGGYVPQEFRERQYVVSDWQQRRYAPPPRGYQYVQGGGSDVVLAAIATGLIASIILSN